jgi:hypothetical protein
MNPSFSATEHHVHRPHVATAGCVIVFLVNLSGITGMFPIVIKENTGSIERTNPDGQVAAATVSGTCVELRSLKWEIFGRC